MSKAILVLGATGKQGGSVVRALLAHPKLSADAYTIYAATRNPGSASALRLSALSPTVKPVFGDLKDAATAMTALPTKPWAVFVMSYPGKTEQADGISAIDAAFKAGSSHVVLSSVDRGAGSPPTNVPHFITKHNIEQHLKAISRQSQNRFTYTIIRPTYFLDNIEAGTWLFGRLFATLWKDKVTGPLAVIDCADIGTFASAAILEFDSPNYRNAEINITGDRLTFEAANQIFSSKTGQNIPVTYSFLVDLLLFVSNDVRKMTEFFNNPGFSARVEDMASVQPLTDFAKWVDRSKHTKKDI